MQCVTPMFYYYKIGDKKHGKIVPRTEVMSELNFDPNAIRNYLSIANKRALKKGSKYIKVPCNKCWACQLKYSAEWATRIMLEAKKYETNFFITLTYDDKHVPIAEKTEWEQYDLDPKDPHGKKIITHQIRHNDGTWGYTLLPKDMETFLNSLRKHFERKGHTGIKYFYCGEYGTNTARPHYHIILMNCPLNIEEFYDTFVDNNFKAHWKSKEIEEYWNKGMVDIAELEWSAAAYVARYCTKKLNPDQDKRAYLENGKLPEFIRMSKGIGFDYFYEHKDEIYKNDELIMKTIKNNTGSIKPPRAFDRKLEKINPKLMAAIKKSRMKAAERANQLIEQVTDYTDKAMIGIEAGKLDTKMSLLPRAGEW